MNYGYARVSSIGQKISGNSLEDQISQLKAAQSRSHLRLSSRLKKVCPGRNLGSAGRRGIGIADFSHYTCSVLL